MLGAKMQGTLVARNSSVAARKAARRPSQSDSGPLHEEVLDELEQSESKHMSTCTKGKR